VEVFPDAALDATDQGMGRAPSSEVVEKSSEVVET
jgi:hypothetical protein